MTWSRQKWKLHCVPLSVTNKLSTTNSAGADREGQLPLQCTSKSKYAHQVPAAPLAPETTPHKGASQFLCSACGLDPLVSAFQALGLQEHLTCYSSEDWTQGPTAYSSAPTAYSSAIHHSQLSHLPTAWKLCEHIRKGRTEGRREGERGPHGASKAQSQTPSRSSGTTQGPLCHLM